MKLTLFLWLFIIVYQVNFCLQASENRKLNSVCDIKNPVQFLAQWECNNTVQSQVRFMLRAVELNEIEARKVIIAEKEEEQQGFYEIYHRFHKMCGWNRGVSDGLSMPVVVVNDLRVQSNDELDQLYKTLSRPPSPGVVVNQPQSANSNEQRVGLEDDL